MHLTRVHKAAIGGGLVLVLLAVTFFVILPMRRPAAKIGFGHWEPGDWAKQGTMAQVQVSTPAGAGAAPAVATLALSTGASLPKADAAPAFSGQPYYGTYTSDVIKARAPFNWAVASWNADTPPGTWIQVDLRVTIGDHQSRWYTMGVWASGEETIKRQSVGSQSDADGMVATDTLMLKSDAKAYQYRLTLYTTDPAVTPDMRSFSIVTTNRNVADRAIESDKSAWGTELAVPERSQMDFLPEGSGWCSPTSTSMVMEYWANQTGRAEWNQTVPTVAGVAYDNVYEGTGNWPFCTAAAASFGLNSFVTRFESLTQAEQWVKAGVPVVIGIHFGTNQLKGAPISSTDGHLIVIRGFDASGNVICNDPAASRADGQQVRIVYDRAELARAWLSANGIAYIIYPAGHEIPGNSYGAWVEPGK